MTYSEGALLLVDFTTKVASSGEIINTTREESENIDPALVSIGSIAFPVIKGVEDLLKEAEEGVTVKGIIPPEKGYGKRDPSKVRMVPLRKFGDDADSISVGETVTLDNKRAIVRFIGSGRVRIDYNHQYAGKNIECEATVIKHLKEDGEKVESIITDRFPPGDAPSFAIDGNKVNIDINQQLARQENIQIVKMMLKEDIFTFASGIDEIVYTETFQRQSPSKYKDESESEEVIEDVESEGVESEDTNR